MKTRKIFLILVFILLIMGCNKVNHEKEDVIVNNIYVSLNGKEYLINLEDNSAVKEFIKMLPKDFEMQDLNNNEKYVYMDTSLKTNSYSPKYINKGDLMLYGDNCLVLFYKSFNTNYSYTKIGHIDNLEDLSNGNIKLSFIVKE